MASNFAHHFHVVVLYDENVLQLENVQSVKFRASGANRLTIWHIWLHGNIFPNGWINFLSGQLLHKQMKYRSIEWPVWPGWSQACQYRPHKGEVLGAIPTKLIHRQDPRDWDMWMRLRWEKAGEEPRHDTGKWAKFKKTTSPQRARRRTETNQNKRTWFFRKWILLRNSTA